MSDKNSRDRDDENIKKIIDDIEDGEGVIDNEIIKIAAEDVEVSSHQTTKLQKEKEKKQDTFYSDLVYTLTNIRMLELEARITWGDILEHKWGMGVAMKRNVGIRVAALDYFQNVLKKVDDVRIIDSSHYIATKKLVVTDGLTGLFNHRYFYEKLQIMFRQFREKKIKNIGLLVIDIDYFKQYNDANGHLAGDIVLIGMAKIFRSTAGQRGTVFRYGGEEFAVLISAVGIEELKEIAENVVSKVRYTSFDNEGVVPGGSLTVSIGCSVMPDITKRAKDFFKSADDALYAAKKFGRNQVHIAEG